MSGGGTTTTTTNNTPFNAQYLDQIDAAAANLFANNPINYYPGQTYASEPGYVDTALANAGQGFLGAGNSLMGLLPGAQSTALSNATTLAGGGGLVNTLANGTAANQLTNIANQGLNILSSPAASILSNASTGDLAQMNGTAANQLAATANGAYLGANPYLTGMFNAAAQPLTTAYMTATAPQTDSQMEAAGRFNSGATQNAQAANEQNLGNSLANLSSNLYGNAYENERNLMTQAAGTLGNLDLGALSQSASAGQALGNLQTGGLGIANSAASGVGGLQTAALGAQENAINSMPTLSALPSQDYNTSINAGLQAQQLTQQQLNDLAQRYYGTEMAPWSTLQEESGIVGGAIPGLSTTTTPYYTNPFGQVLGGALGTAALGNTLFGSSSGGLLGAVGLGK
jgi:hypothetical protein